MSLSFFAESVGVRNTHTQLSFSDKPWCVLVQRGLFVCLFVNKIIDYVILLLPFVVNDNLS